MVDVAKVVNKLKREMRSGIYSFLILSMLEKGEMHGYLIRKKLEDLNFAPSEGALYDMLKGLERLGLIEGFWVMEKRPRKCYRLTGLGRIVLRELKSEVDVILKVLRGVGNG